ncbi:hypothetical protein HBI54_018970 [Parastagonospora nodorum]|nr:hypothetical protein HBI54_018970 [Parastagonospora nodorum]
MNSACQIRLFVNAPRAYANHKHQNRAGSKFGGGVASQVHAQAALETIDLDKDPYFFKNHVGSFEYQFCPAVDRNDSSCLTHNPDKDFYVELSDRVR